jgi:hypothetical protein
MMAWDAGWLSGMTNGLRPDTLPAVGPCPRLSVCSVSSSSAATPADVPQQRRLAALPWIFRPGSEWLSGKVVRHGNSYATSSVCERKVIQKRRAAGTPERGRQQGNMYALNPDHKKHKQEMGT